MENSNKYYKVLSGDFKSPSTSFDYWASLPTSSSFGKWLPEIKGARISKDGYYASRHWNMWYKPGDRIFEVECEGIVGADACGVEKQICCSRMRLLRDVTDILSKSVADSSGSASNTGHLNTGTGNTGNCNTGDFNTGSRNTGNLNAGDFNTGDSNEGIDNVGDRNRGSGNVGCDNRGHSNTGNGNIGSFNSGTRNIGNANSGSFNKGNRNVGSWNVGDYNVGYFNTLKQCAYMFNKPTDLPQSRIVLPKWLNFPDYKERFETEPVEEIRKAIELPNFDYAIFEKITGISKSDFDRRLSSK